MECAKNNFHYSTSNDICNGLVVDLTVDVERSWDSHFFISQARKIPKSWSEAEIIIIYNRKEEKTEFNNYRGITLQDIGYKVLASIIKNRKTPKMEKEIGEIYFRGGKNFQNQRNSNRK